MSLIYNGLVPLSSLSLFLLLAWICRGITYINASRTLDGKVSMTDAHKQALGAANLKGWTWPSRIHQLSGGKARMKDVGVLGVALLQHLLKDKTGFYPFFLLSNLAACASAVMIYLVAAHYWNPAIGFLLFGLYLTCFWPHQISLSGGYHNLAQFFLLFAVYSLSWSELVSGAALGLMMFASASGRKFLPLFVGVFGWEKWDLLQIAWPEKNLWLFFLSLSAGAVLILLTIYFGYRPLLKILYLEKGPAWANRLLQNRPKHPLDYYWQQRGKTIKGGAKIFLGCLGLILGVLVLSREWEFYSALLSMGLGFMLICFWMTAPDILTNLKEYFVYWYTPKKSCHFLIYKDFFAKIGKPISDTMRGAGWKWILLFFSANTPWHVGFYGIALILAFYSSGNVGVTLAMVVLSLSPIFYGEITRSPQFSRPYFPGLLGLLSFIGYGFFHFEQALALEQRFLFWLVTAAGVAISALWNGWIFFNDVLPARMAPVRLGEALKKRNIKKFYTYDTSYNDAFVFALLENNQQDFDVEYIHSLSEVDQGYVVIPGTSSKALNIEGHREGIQGEDFNRDPILTKLIESKTIQHHTIASFKTFGTSRIWGLDSEMPCYRQLILKDIDAKDRWRGRAWLIKYCSSAN